MIDAHQHFWDTRRFQYPWMSDTVAPIRRPFGPDDLAPLARARGVEKTVVVQAQMVPAENSYLLELAAGGDLVAGVVGWVDLTAPDVAQQLAAAQSLPGGSHLVGVRHQVEDEPDPRWLLGEDVQRGLAAVESADLAYDLLVKPHQLSAAVEVARRFPGLRLVLDHLAKPPIKAHEVEEWARAMAPFAGLDHVHCKLSGMVTEADWATWRPADLEPYVERALEWFGPERCMFGSDWPVCLLAGTYDQVLDALLEILSTRLSTVELEAVMGDNAARFYGI